MGRSKTAGAESLWFDFDVEQAASAVELPTIEETCLTSDASERRRALDPRQSFVVQAPAGSGKTELLIQRYLTLLARVAEPEQIVAITFTVKAAGEMRSRVLEALRRARTAPEPGRAHERETWRISREALARNDERGWQLLQNPERMRIQTIDALSMAITRHMPWTARFGAMPQVTEDARLLFREGATNTIRRLGDDTVQAHAVETLLRHLDNDAAIAVELLAGMVESRDHWLRIMGVGADPRRVRVALESTLQKIIEEALDGFAKALPVEVGGELAVLARYAAANVAPDSPIASCRDLREVPGVTHTALVQWRGIAELLLTREGEWRQNVNARQGFPPGDRPTKARFEQLLACVRRENSLRERLAALSKLPEPSFSDSQWQVLDAVFRLLPTAVAELKLVFAERGIVDFTEIGQAAGRALGTRENPTDLALAMGSRIEHLLVDEFQDTSIAQYELLAALTAHWSDGDGRTIFLVGDPMQSIYRFRQAEVGLFLKARQYGVGEIVPEPLTLTANFRSAANIVDWINSVFACAFPVAEDIRTGSVAYSASAAFRGTDDSGGVFIHPMLGRDDAHEATIALQLIEQARGSGTCAVLVRARTHLFAIAEELRRRGIRFRAIEIDSLGERPVVQDLLSLTRALLHLADRPAWLAILRAPWCGLTLADLEALSGNDQRATVWDLLRRPGLTLSDDADQRLARVVPILEQTLAARGRQPVRRVVESTWAMLGGPACLTGDADLEDAAAYLDLLDQLQDAGDIPDMTAFIARVNELFAKADPAADASLELMTIHKAKGLEFDTVILPGLGRVPRPEEPKLLLWTERTTRDGEEVLIAPISGRRDDRDPIYAYLSGIERQKAELESVRLLYVACTRAKQRLHLIAHVETKVENNVPVLSNPAHGSLLEHLWASVRPSFEIALERETAPAVETNAVKPWQSIRRLPRDWSTLEPPEGIKLARLRSAEASANGDEITFDWVGDTLRHIGTVVHRMLARIARDGVERWTPEKIAAQKDSISIALATLGVPDAEIEAAAAQTIAALARTIGDDRGRWILSAHSDAHSEFELSGIADGVPCRIVVDRTFVDDEGTRWVIDFKTSTHAGSDVDAFLASELRRYERQLENYANLVSELDSRPVRAGLYFPLLTRFVESTACTRPCLSANGR